MKHGKLRVALLLSGLHLLLPGGVAADCMQVELPYVATLKVASCVDVVDVAAKRLEGNSLGWVSGIVDNVLRQRQGVVVAGKVTQKIYVTWHSVNDFTVEDFQLVEEEARWFVPADDPDACGSMQPGAEVELLITQPCCDVTPPSDVPCLLELGSAQSVPPALRELLGRG